MSCRNFRRSTIENIWTHMMDIKCFSSILSQTTKMVPVLGLVFTGATPSATFINSSGLIGSKKRLGLYAPCFDYVSVKGTLLNCNVHHSCILKGNVFAWVMCAPVWQ